MIKPLKVLLLKEIRVCIMYVIGSIYVYGKIAVWEIKGATMAFRSGRVLFSSHNSHFPHLEESCSKYKAQSSGCNTIIFS